MSKTADTNPEFDNFTGFMDKLAKVPHSEVKAELDKEREAKTKAARRPGRPKRLKMVRKELSSLGDPMTHLLKR